MSYKAKIFTREEAGNVITAAISDYEHAPAKPRWRNETTSV